MPTSPCMSGVVVSASTEYVQLRGGGSVDLGLWPQPSLGLGLAGPFPFFPLTARALIRPNQYQ